MSVGSKLAELHPRAFFRDTWRAIDGGRQDAATASRDVEPAVAMIVGAVVLILMEYGGGLDGLRALFALLDGATPAEDGLEARLRASGFWDMAKLAHWSGARVIGYFVLPAIVIKLRGARVRDQYLTTTGLAQHAWMYGIAYAIVFVCVVIASFTSEFSTYYPFYDLAHRSWMDFVSWELMYAAHFFALEFFFRGFVLRSCERSFGSQAIFVSMVPYVMVHFGKPMVETFGALIAGVFLGTLAMRTRSIWLGFAIHVSIAWSMDVAALLQTRGLPTVWMPPY